MNIQNAAVIVSELKRGSTKALHAVHDLYYPALRNFAMSLVGDGPAAEDIVAEVFVTLWKKHEDFETLQNIKAFVYISTRNACINHIKKLQRDVVMKSGLTNYLSVDHEEFALNEMIRAEVLQQIYEAIEALPSQCKKVFKLCYVEGLTNSEVAERFAISVNTVKNHKVKALGLLRLKFLNGPAMSVLGAMVYFFV
ncbi:RNA polymerase sigma-70 factor [Flavitalea sp. BT771]|uniref:RNA polymerase sigma-70 factor n=1 Tax=Flavitalea sp. BT771 TaxID=3063329 RepID=UPI0026E3586A|nr:RNA polymerase sigma-70 factor [Flavitalea sp. BT771]MDO6432053.1 RNA polymerase sigma-70 factor [Flavitalea sp. BT771]MDV6220962.1 RNA polymerase sigma-70 factor [Flavitalea sp. BT771]